MGNFDEVKVYTGKEQGEVTETSLTQKVNGGSLLSVEQSRAIAETQAAMIMAKLNPRDENNAYMRITKACQRKSLAQSAIYSFPRGGKNVTGASIRLAEVLARYWGNCQYGMNELSRENGVSHVEAFFWDLETNTRITRRFTVKHWRDTKGGGHALDSERDVYELVANYGQRRVRACILEGIPGDIVEEAVNKCRETMVKADNIPLEDRIRKMLTAFADLGVTQAEIEQRLAHQLTAPPTTREELAELQEVYQSLRDGIGKKEEFFKSVYTNSKFPNETEPVKTKKKKEPKKIEVQQDLLSEPDVDEAPGAEDQVFIEENGNDNDLNAMAEALAGADVETELLRIRAEIEARQQQ